MININSVVKQITLDEVKEFINNPNAEVVYALIYMFSKVVLDKISNIKAFDWEQVNEIYLFGDNEEIHVFRDEDKFSAVLCNDANMSDFIRNEQKYELAGQFIETTKKTIVKVVEYLDKDEDGQIFVAYKRLAGLE